MTKPKTAADLRIGDQIPTRRPCAMGPVTVVAIEHEPATAAWPYACVWVTIECGMDADPFGDDVFAACGARASDYVSGLRPPHRYLLRYDPADPIAETGDEPVDTYTAKRLARKKENS